MQIKGLLCAWFLYLSFISFEIIHSKGIINIFVTKTPRCLNILFYFHQNHLMAARKAFDKFFIHYPYCYGYWKKYADLEKRHDNIKQSDEVRTSVNKVISIRYCKPNNKTKTFFFGWQYLRFVVKQFYRVFYLHLSLLWHL